jgi:DNA-directed RNA polymerase subunit RPC12/RpoP
MRSEANTRMSREKTDRLCVDCGEAFSAFLNEMAAHNAKVTACPKCGKHHDFKPPKAAKPAARARLLKRTSSFDRGRPNDTR